jgi:pyruvate-formate lyase-activating enzyme
MTKIFDFIKNMKSIEHIHLLPYHNIHSDKYKKLGMEYELPRLSGAESPNIGKIKEIFAAKFPVKIGG